jgi:formylglycine-generating enzyme required for sulfatase activity
MKRQITVFFAIMLASTISANNVAVTNIKLTGQNNIAGVNNAANYTMVQFDISWENSFRATTGPANWDAAWVFVKYRIPIANGGDGFWKHITLNPTGHTAPPGSTIVTASDCKGVFIYRDANGNGTFSKTGVQLRWNYGVNGIADNAVIDIGVFAIEMVYVPQGAYYLGSGGTERGSFTDGSWNGTDAVTPTIPFLITSENAITVAHSAGNLWYSLLWWDYYGDQAGPVPGAFTKGFAAFYCMKYELSQQAYVEFLNTLTYNQQISRTIIAPNSPAGTYLWNYNRYKIKILTSGTDNTVPAIYTTDNPNVSCNFINWADMAAYLDWSGLRPMTELEFEKACRGTAAPVPNEYAWGTVTIASSLYTLSNNGMNNEGIASNYSTTAGNATYLGTDPAGGSIDGPVRVGIFAGNPGNTGRVTAGATYYGIMEMSGNNWERTVTVGDAAGRSFTGLQGDGSLNGSGQATVDYWPGINGNNTRTTPNTAYGGVTGITNAAAAGSGFKGSDWDCEYRLLQVSDRFDGEYLITGRCTSCGCRGVRTMP